MDYYSYDEYLIQSENENLREEELERKEERIKESLERGAFGV